MKIFSKAMIITLLISVALVSGEYMSIHTLAASEGSTIGSISVKDLSESDLKKKLNTAIAEWKNNKIEIMIGNHKVRLSGDDFLFDVDASIQQYEVAIDKPWYAFWEKTPIVHEPLQVKANHSLIEKIESEAKLKGGNIDQQVLEAASYLKKSPIEIQINDVSIEDAERISFESISIPDNLQTEVETIAKELDGIMIEPEKTFSFNKVATQVGSNDDAMSLVASALYSTVLQSSFEVIERHQAEDIPTYVKPGYEASVSPFLEQDLQFVSHSHVLAKIMAKVEDGKLKVSLYSLPGNPQVTISEKDRQTVAPRTIYRYTKSLDEGESKTIQQSKPGLWLLIFRTITDENGDTKTQLISQNYYAPKNEIIEKSSIEAPADTNATANAEDGNTDNTNGTDENVGQSNHGQTEDNSSHSNNSKSQTNKDQSNTSTHKKATESKNGGTVPKGSYYNDSGDIVTPKDTK